MPEQNVIHGLEYIETMRRFNRFYTRQIGLLNDGLLKSEFSLTEARILYELANHDNLTATDLTRELGLDAGYLSRILKKFEKRGLLTRQDSRSDARQTLLNLSQAGRMAFEPLNQASREEIAGMLSKLSSNEKQRLLHAMQTIEKLLGEKAEPAVPYILRPHQIGDIGWVARRQGMLYAQEYGWDETFEAFVAEIGAGFIKNYDPKWERCWIAEREGKIVGSVFLVRESDDAAKLRMLYVEPEARGLGIGSRLTDECIRFARQKRYKALTLWTNDILVSARRIYQAAGFKLISEEKHCSFGKDLVGQYWELAL